MSETEAETDPQSRQMDQSPMVPTLKSALKLHVGGFLLLALTLGLLVLLTPDMVEIFGAESAVEQYQDEIPDTVGAVGGMTKIAVGLYAALYIMVFGPMLGGVLGAITALRSNVDRLTVSVSSGVAAFTGYLVMFSLLFLIAGGSVPRYSPDAGATIVGGMKLGLPTGLASAGMAFLASMRFPDFSRV